MFHAGSAAELAKTLVEDRRNGSGRRLLSDADRERIHALEERERSARAFEQALSVGGALALLAIVLWGVAGALAFAGAAIAVAVAATRGRRVARLHGLRPSTDPDDHWGVWRRVEPDAEYLRGRAA
jgi:hypothetical protein